jgi:hypothetical protein
MSLSAEPDRVPDFEDFDAVCIRPVESGEYNESGRGSLPLSPGIPFFGRVFPAYRISEEFSKGGNLLRIDVKDGWIVKFEPVVTVEFYLKDNLVSRECLDVARHVPCIWELGYSEGPPLGPLELTYVDPLTGGRTVCDRVFCVMDEESIEDGPSTNPPSQQVHQVSRQVHQGSNLYCCQCGI